MCHWPNKRKKKKLPDIDSIYDYLSRTEAKDKVSVDLTLNELVKGKLQ